MYYYCAAPQQVVRARPAGGERSEAARARGHDGRKVHNTHLAPSCHASRRHCSRRQTDRDRGGARVRVRRGQGSHHLRVLVASGRRGGGGAALGPGCWPEGRHVDRGAGNGPGVRVGGALGGRGGGEYGCARGRIFFFLKEIVFQLMF